MQVIYEGKNIAGDIEVWKIDLTDNAGGELDSLELGVDDPKGLWSQWKPEKNHTVQIKESGFDSGIMYVDEVGQQRGAVTLRALPVKQEAKAESIKAWDKVRFLEIAQEIAGKHTLQLKTYGTSNHFYERVDQQGLTDFHFLAWRCMLEGAALKISNGQLIIYDQAYMEAQPPVRTISINDVDGDFVFRNKSSGVYGACKISCRDIQYEFKVPGTYGPTLKYYDLAVNSLGEAERFCKGLLRARNCLEKTFACTVRFDAGIAAGNTVNLSGFGLADGKYFADRVVHKFADNKTVLRLRKPLEGY